MNLKPGLGEIALWGTFFAFTWTLGSLLPALLLYENINQIPTTQPTFESLLLLQKIIVPWAMIGFIVGIFGLYYYIYLVEKYIYLVVDPLDFAGIYKKYLMKMLKLSLIVGALLGLILPIFSSSEDVALRPFSWRVPISALAGIFGTSIALHWIVERGRKIWGKPQS